MKFATRWIVAVVTMKKQLRKSFFTMIALVLGMACTQSAPAQHFKRVNVKGGAPLVQIAAGGASVWARAANGNPYIFKGKQFVLANSLSLTQLAVGGGNTFQPDAVWGLDSSCLIYRAAKRGTSWVFSQVPGLLDFIAVGIGYQDSCHPYEVWGLDPGLDPAANIYRYNFCGQNFEQVAGTLGSLAVGGGGIWGINGSGNIYRFNFETLNFDLVDARHFTQITVGPNSVWVIFSPSDAFWFDGVAKTFYKLFADATQLQAGGNGVWAIGSNQNIYRLDESGARFIQLPGALVSISVGSGGGVWGLDGSGKAYGFTAP